jgi:hypothetical protein
MSSFDFNPKNRKENIPIISGNWGCGVFKGDV